MLISPRIAARLPVRIDISWMRGLAGRDQVAQTELKPLPGSDSPDQSRLMNQILELNPTASMDFLAQFSPSALGEYLEHLNAASMPRGRASRRVRPANIPGVTVRTTRI